MNVVLNFLSPEHATESIKLVDELNQLPQRVKTKANKIKVSSFFFLKKTRLIIEKECCFMYIYVLLLNPGEENGNL